MGFSTNYEGIGEGGLLPEGEYECVVRSAAETTTKNGIPCFDVRFVIRNDIDQKFRNKFIFHTIWKKKDPSPADSQMGGFSFKQIMALAKAAGVPSGKEYNSLNEMGGDMIGKPVLVTVEHNTYNGNTTERVKFVNETQNKDCKHVFKDSTPVTPTAYAKPQEQSFASAPTSAVNLDPDDFEIIGEEDVPF